MKIGIITFYRPINIGAILQATATNQIVLKNLNYQSDLIDYRFARTEFYRKAFNIKRVSKERGFKNKIKCLARELLFFPKRIKAKRNADIFLNKYLTTTKPFKTFDSLRELNEYFDAFLIGSDLVWNPLMSQNFDPFFFGKFADESKLVFSYAASVGEKNIEQKDLKTICDNISTLSSVSVREKTTASLLSDYSGIQVVPVLDPTLLTCKKDWERFESKRSFSKNKYIFVYMLENSENLISFAKKIAKERKLDIITFDSKRKFHCNRVRAVPTIGPDSFLTLIRDAELILTNSLHGCAFSIIYEKQFYAFPHSTRNIRMTDLLDDLSLSRRMISNGGAFENDIIDYTDVKKRLEKLKSSSLSFLLNALERRR